MRIVSLTAENFKILRAVEIRPDGNIVTIGGKNEQGKSSVLDAIWVGLVGRSAAPPKPVRDGEEKCTIRLDLGEIVVTRRFTAKEGGKFTDTVKVEDEEGKVYPRSQEVLDALLGEIGFDPFAFVQMKPADQAEMLLQLVPLPIDIDEMAELDTEAYDKRRLVNRKADELKGQLAGFPEEEVPADAPDRGALVEELTKASDTNAAILAEQQRRQNEEFAIANGKEEIAASIEAIGKLREQADRMEAEARDKAAGIEEREQVLQGLDPLPELVDAAAIRAKLDAADEFENKRRRQDRRKEIAAELEAAEKESAELTAQMEKRDQQRKDALAKAKMPVPTLGFEIVNGKAIVTLKGQPFEQASSAEKIRASTAIAMAANPNLRVLRISDGSLLDEDSMKMLEEMAADEDFQLWIEKVGTGGVGFVLEAGEVKAPAKK